MLELLPLLSLLTSRPESIIVFWNQFRVVGSGERFGIKLAKIEFREEMFIEF